ncbi:pyridoxamine 5'-phosphate oxidase family protein [uncultured Enterovirga sp.]|uniref:pyridoxamine 5'-phosphate oxidase family protein n=1 Tax=uncultured Enterovirga sp. TaxID=2026352 RepID=UPI0035CADA3D
MTVQARETLRSRFGPMLPLAERKVLPRLDGHARAFIALSPFLVLASSDPEGGVDASPRGDPPGFVQVLDDRTLLLPDRHGNNRLDTFCNLLGGPQVGLIFFVPGIGETLRVNGTAEATFDPDLLAACAVNGRPPIAGLVVTVREAFFHCAKSAIRSKLWDPSRHLDRSAFPSFGRIIADQTESDADEIDSRTEDGYRTKLY